MHTETDLTAANDYDAANDIKPWESGVFVLLTGSGLIALIVCLLAQALF